MVKAQIIIDESKMNKKQYEALMKVCKNHDITYAKASDVKKAGPKYKISKTTEEKFKLIYKRWVADDITMAEALQELGNIKKPTFYRNMKRFGLPLKSNIKVQERAQAILLGVDEKGLVVSHQMKIRDILEVVTAAVNIAGLKPRVTELGIEHLEVATCCFVLDKMNYEGSKQGFADGMNISKSTYLKYMEKFEDSQELYCFANRIYKMITVLPK